MDPLKGKDPQQEYRPLCAENGSNNSKDSKSLVVSPTPGCSFWYEGFKEVRQDQSKNRDQNNLDGESSASKVHGMPKENTPEVTQDQFANQAAYQGYGYGTTSDQAYIELQNSNAAMMSMYSAYGPMATMNPQWTMNPLDGMNMQTGMNVCRAIDMTGNPAANINPYAYMSMTADPNVYGMMGMANYGYGMKGNEATMMGPAKEIIHLSLSSLYPPNPTAPPPSTLPKPLGCKTVFVGGLPENTTEETMKEIFQSVGEICTVRMSKKNFCHIRFKEEASVDSAVYYSGYRLKISNKDDSANTGRLHVDFAQARDDQYEYECRQRSLQREARHRERLEQELYRPPTPPPPVVYYTDHEASILGEKLRNKEKYQQAIFVLVTWLDRGECNRRNACYFYSMIQSITSHVSRLMNEKDKYEEELNEAKLMLKQQMRGILLQFHDIDKVFNAASLQKVWDHFTTAQRKNIALWKKQTAEIKHAHVQDVLNDRVEDEMDISEDEADNTEGTENNSLKNDAKSVPVKEIEKLKEENDSLRCQLLASENEMGVLSLEIKKEKDLKEVVLQSLRDNCYPDTWKKRLQTAPELPPSKFRKSDWEDKDGGESCRIKSKEKNVKDGSGSEIPLNKCSETDKLSTPNSFAVSPVDDVHYIGLISTFLNIHPFGASVDYICSYLHQINSTVRARDVESLMKKFPSVFKEESTGIGASLQKKWIFCGFISQSIISKSAI